MSNFAQVKQWHRAFSVPVAKHPQLPAGRIGLRKSLIEEEVQELFDAIDANDIYEVADALADILYVVYGTAAEFGIPIDEIFAEVHKSNMSKLGEDGKPVYRGDGKVLKGPNFKLPDIIGVFANEVQAY